MFRRKIYYALKPFIPWRIRIGIRRRFAIRKYNRIKEVWPIDESTAKPPANWPGWPDSKDFAFILTHDVESQKGLDQVKQLAELEMELGFRSSFNFIPEGEYKVPAELINWLHDNGFEVGVHDLHHDGKLYSTRENFARSAIRINEYIKDWGAVGFRSGFMHHNLDWVHDLDIAYDASTFDNDPFEPQPDAAHTIFPFFVSYEKSPTSDLRPLSQPPDHAVASPEGHRTNASMRGGYLELPYTLPQDSTLFFVLKEQDDSIWRQKLDWLVEKKAMALVNVHPDYINFSTGKSQANEFSAAHYRSFLTYVKSRYTGRYWHGLPKTLASKMNSSPIIRTTRQPLRICHLSYSNYESDGRILRYAETLSKRGDDVEAIACTTPHEERETIDWNGVTLHKIYYRECNRKGGAISFFWPLCVFAVKSFWHISKLHLRKPYDVIHVHNIPEWLVFSALIPKLGGAKIILDLHDLVPELFTTKFKKGSRSIFDKLLRIAESLSCRFADHVIVSNHLWLKTVNDRSAPTEKTSAFVNNIDPDQFYRRTKTRTDNKKIVLFPGTLQWHQGVDIAIRAFPKVKVAIPEAEFHIYGGGGVTDELKQLTKELDLNGTVKFFDIVLITEVPQLIANADLGVVPKRADSFGNEAYSTKIMEFMSQGVPTVISRTAIDQYYFSDEETIFCESGNVNEFAQAMIKALTDSETRDRLIENAALYVRKNDWKSRRRDYEKIVDNLAFDRPARTYINCEIYQPQNTI